jgi:hypothetical protein
MGFCFIASRIASISCMRFPPDTGKAELGRGIDVGVMSSWTGWSELNDGERPTTLHPSYTAIGPLHHRCRFLLEPAARYVQDLRCKVRAETGLSTHTSTCARVQSKLSLHISVIRFILSIRFLVAISSAHKYVSSTHL